MFIISVLAVIKPTHRFLLAILTVNGIISATIWELPLARLLLAPPLLLVLPLLQVAPLPLLLVLPREVQDAENVVLRADAFEVEML